MQEASFESYVCVADQVCPPDSGHDLKLNKFNLGVLMPVRQLLLPVCKKPEVLLLTGHPQGTTSNPPAIVPNQESR